MDQGGANLERDNISLYRDIALAPGPPPPDPSERRSLSPAEGGSGGANRENAEALARSIGDEQDDEA